MKKTILMMAVVLSGSFANAKLSTDCANSMQDAANGYIRSQGYSSAEVTVGEKSVLGQMWLNTAKAAALTCSGIAELRRENSEQVYQEAINYFNSLIGQ